MRAGKRGAAQCGVVGKRRIGNGLADRRESRVLQLAHVTVLIAAMFLRPAQEDVTHRPA